MNSADVTFVPEENCTKSQQKDENSFSLQPISDKDEEGAFSEVDEGAVHSMHESDLEGENGNSDENRNPEEENDVQNCEKKNDAVSTQCGRVVNAPEYLKHYVCSASNNLDWSNAMDEEMQALRENNVYEVVDRPKGKKVIGTKWILKEKLRSDGTLDRLKARLVAR